MGEEEEVYSPDRNKLASWRSSNTASPAELWTHLFRFYRYLDCFIYLSVDNIGYLLFKEYKGNNLSLIAIVQGGTNKFIMRKTRTDVFFVHILPSGLWITNTAFKFRIYQKVSLIVTPDLGDVTGI